MSIFERDRSAERLPVSVITGFLGSGKTTILKHLLAQQGMADSAVIINEFGEVGLDHLLVERVDGETVVLASGCVCCALRSDLETTLRSMLAQMRKGEIPPFSRVLVETTGLADPAPICQMLLNNPLVSHFFRLDTLVATTDAVHGLAQIEERDEAMKQAAMADRLLLTKTDLAAEPTLAALENALAALNPGARRIRVSHGVVEPSALFGGSGYDPETKTRDVRAWLASSDAATSAPHHHGAIRAFSLRFDEPLDWPSFQARLAWLRQAHGERLLRLKGILNLAGVSGPVVVQGVHHVFHPPVELARWPDGDRCSRLVCITDGLDEATIRAALEDTAASEAVQA